MIVSGDSSHQYILFTVRFSSFPAVSIVLYFHSLSFRLHLFYGFVIFTSVMLFCSSRHRCHLHQKAFLFQEHPFQCIDRKVTNRSVNTQLLSCTKYQIDILNYEYVNQSYIVHKTARFSTHLSEFQCVDNVTRIFNGTEQFSSRTRFDLQIFVHILS